MLLPVSHCLQVLFTVVPREEKYSAKLVIDTVVQRLGDAIAAAAFQVLGKRPVPRRAVQKKHGLVASNSLDFCCCYAISQVLGMALRLAANTLQLVIR